MYIEFLIVIANCWLIPSIVRRNSWAITKKLLKRSSFEMKWKYIVQNLAKSLSFYHA